MLGFCDHFRTDKDFLLGNQSRFLEHIMQMQETTEREGDAKQESSVGSNQSKD